MNWKIFGLAAALFAAAFVVYSDSLPSGFVWDDHVLIEGNAFIEKPANALVLVRQLLLRPAVPIRGGARPFFLLSLLGDHALWGENPSGYHLTNIIIHSLNTVLVWQVGQLFLSPGAALASGFIFAVHPINTEAVNLPGFRPDLLTAFFILLALMSYVKLEKESKPWNKSLFLSLSAVFYLLGLLSKEMAITFPLLALWHDVSLGHPRKGKKGKKAALIWRGSAMAIYAAATIYYLAYRSPRTSYQAIGTDVLAQQPAPASLAKASHVLPKAISPPKKEKNKPILLPGAERKEGNKNSFKVIRLVMVGGTQQTREPSPPQWRAIYHHPLLNFRTMSVVFAGYFRLLIVPYPLHADRAPPVIISWRDIRLWGAWAWLGLMLFILVWAYWRGHRPLAWSLGWCFIALLPVSNIIPLYNPMAERYLYLPAIGASWAMGYALAKAVSRGSSYLRRSARLGALAPSFFPIIAAVILAPYTWITFARNLDWRNDATIFFREASLSTSNARVYYNVGYMLQSQGDFAGATQNYQKALALNPGSVEALSNLALVDEMLGKPIEAVELYRKAAVLDPENPIVTQNLNRLLKDVGQIPPP